MPLKYQVQAARGMSEENLPTKKTKSQKLKELELLGAIKNSEITSENHKNYLEEYF